MDVLADSSSAHSILKRFLCSDWMSGNLRGIINAFVLGGFMKEFELNINEALEDCPQNDSESTEENDLVIDLADDEDLYGKLTYCKCKCEFFNECRANKEFCVKAIFAQVLRTLSPRSEYVVRSLYGINCKGKKNINELAEEWHITCERIIQIRDLALKRLRGPGISRAPLRSIDMRWVLLSVDKTPYLDLWKDAFNETRSRDVLYEDFLEEYCNKKREDIEKIQQQIDRAEWLKKKIYAQHNITDDNTLTDCCFGDKYEGEILECDLKVGEIRHWNGGEVYKLCNYNKILFEEVISVLLSNNVFLSDYPANTNVQIYFKKVYNEYSTKRRKEALSIPIDELCFSVRTYNCLKRAGITIVEDLILRTEDEVKQIRNMGTKSLDEIKECLASYELCLLGAKLPSAISSYNSFDNKKMKY